jgi:hypothetical protein
LKKLFLILKSSLIYKRCININENNNNKSIGFNGSEEY